MSLRCDGAVTEDRSCRRHQIYPPGKCPSRKAGTGESQRCRRYDVMAVTAAEGGFAVISDFELTPGRHSTSAAVSGGRSWVFPSCRKCIDTRKYAWAGASSYAQPPVPRG